MKQLSLFGFDDTPDRTITPDDGTWRENDWWLAMLRGPRALWRDDDEEAEPLVPYIATSKQETLPGLR